MGEKATFDIFFDNLISVLETYSAAQPSGERFMVYPDRLRDMPASTDVAQVYPYLASITPTDETTQGYTQYDAVYWIDLVVKSKGTRSGAAYTDGDEAAGIRLRYLIKQVIEALFPVGNRRLNLPGGAMAKKGFSASILPLKMQSAERAESAARITLTVGLAWEPVSLAGDELESILVTADAWSALIDTEGGT
jgi:hypothetical protein